MIEGLQFDAETHRYVYEGKPFPSVTRVLRMLETFVGIPADVLDFAAQRGHAVHDACAYDDKDDLDEESVDPTIMPYLEAWRTFKSDANYQPLEIELPVVHGRYEYAGTLDRIGMVNGKVAVIDIKSGILPVIAGPQLAAYLEAYKWMVGGAMVATPPHLPKARFVVQLKPTGLYSLVKYESLEDWGVFRSALEIWRWKEKQQAG